MLAMVKGRNLTSLLLGFAVFALWSGLQLPAAAQSDDAPASLPAPPAEAPDFAPRSSERTAQRYFIEFRSRSAISYGHTFVVFGRVGAPLRRDQVAGLHPVTDSSLVYMLGLVVPVPAETGWSDGDLEAEYLTARYRILLTEPEYKRLVGFIRDLQANSRVWNGATYNCNAFVQVIAHFMGLQTPPPGLLPKDFVNGIRAMNSKPQQVRAQSHARPVRAQASSSTIN